MDQIKISPNVLLPMPVVLVGANVGGRANFMAVGWVTRANVKPPMVAVGINNSRHTFTGIQENKTFSVCLPSRDLAEKTDYCGLVSGKNVDKSTLFHVFYGETKTAPMIEECPVNLECRLRQEVPLPNDSFLIGEIVTAYAQKEFAKAGRLDFRQMGLFFLTMPDNTYWAFGEPIGSAWLMGEKLKQP